MRVIIHTGAHFTEEDRLLKTLLRNAQEFGREGVAVPGPGRYRTLLKDAFQALESAQPAPAAREVLVDAITDTENVARLVLSNAHFFGSPRFALIGGRFYPLAAERLTQMQKLFHPDKIETYFAIRNPATFLQALVGSGSPDQLRDALGDADPRELRWSDCIQHIRERLPAMPLTVWCSEDMPLLWARIIRGMAGLEAGRKIVGGFDLLSSIITADGMKQFRAYLAKHPVMDDAQKTRVMTAFITQYGIEDAMEEEIDLPGWTQDLVEELTELYEDDLQRILNMPGVRVLLP